MVWPFAIVQHGGQLCKLILPDPLDVALGILNTFFDPTVLVA